MKNFLKMLRGKSHRPLKYCLKKASNETSLILTDYTTYSIVGNAPLTCDVAAEVAKSDIVIRFNFPSNTVVTGNRTDVIVMTNHENGHLTLRPKSREAICIKKAKEIWLTYTVEVMKEFSIPPDECIQEHLKYNDWTQSLIWQHGLFKKNYIVDRSTFAESVYNLSLISGEDIKHCPSSGYLIIFALMKFNPKAYVKLFGFTHSGWHGHSWNAEKTFIDNLEKSGRLKRCS